MLHKSSIEAHPVMHMRVPNTVVWEKFDVKNFSSLVWHDENWMHEIFLTLNKKVTFLFIGDSKGRKYFTMNKFHTKISNSEFFPNYGITVWLMQLCSLHLRIYLLLLQIIFTITQPTCGGRNVGFSTYLYTLVKLGHVWVRFRSVPDH